jgi:protein phosphatase 1G
MGAYLSAPVTDKESEDGKSSRVRYGVSAMQGWRRTMEDAHLALPNLTEDEACSLWGVFDGHGGREVSLFVARHLADELQRQEAYHQGRYDEALISIFHRMDDMLRDEVFDDEIRQLKAGPGAPAPSQLTQRPPSQPGGTGGATGAAPGEGGSGSGSATGEAVAVATAEAPPRITPQEAIEMIQKILVITQGNNSAGGSEESPRGLDSPVPFAGQPAPAVERRIGGEAAAAVEEQEHEEEEEEDEEVEVEEDEDDDDEEEEVQENGTLQSLSLPLRAGLGMGRLCSLPDHRVQAGCTSVVALVIGNRLFVANAGDSRAVLCRAGKAVGLSEDHKPLQERELQRIQRAGGFVTEQGRVNGNLNLSRSIGDLKYKGNHSLPPKDQMITAEPDVTVTTLTDEDEFIILACDGIWDCKTNQEAVDFIRPRLLAGDKKLSEIVEELLDDCIADDPRKTTGLGGDNMTCLIVEVNGGPKPRAVDPVGRDEPSP